MPKARKPLRYSDLSPIADIKGSKNIKTISYQYNIPINELINFLQKNGVTNLKPSSIVDIYSIGKILNAFPYKKSEKTIKGKARVGIVCKIYNVSYNTLIDFLKENGIDNLNINSVLDEMTLELIQKQYAKDKGVRDTVRGKTKIEFTKTHSIQNNSFKEPVINLDKNIFHLPKQVIYYKNYTPINSCFSDSEAISICKRMSSAFARNLVSQINKLNQDNYFILYQIHYIANKALEIFGGKMLTFIIGLRELHFKDNSVMEIKTYDKVLPDFPIISFDTGEGTFKISFFLKRNKTKGKLEANIKLLLKNNEEIGSIDIDGFIISKLEKYRPQLSMFYKKIQDNRYNIYSGVESGKCEICGKELTHPTSLRIGLGPQCAKSQKLDDTIYHFDI